MTVSPMANPAAVEDRSADAGLSHWREFCHFDDTPCLSLLKRLIQV